MSQYFGIDTEDHAFNLANFIVGSLIFVIFLLLGYLYFANRAMIAQGQHQNKKYGKKSKKGKEIWSYGD
jgi:hypothetical protein